MFLFAGIFFENLDTDNVKYTIRLDSSGEWNTRMASSSFQTAGARVSPKYVDGNVDHLYCIICIVYFCSPYLNEGFMQLEKIINEAIIELKTGKPVNIDVSVRVRHL